MIFLFFYFFKTNPVIAGYKQDSSRIRRNSFVIMFPLLGAISVSADFHCDKMDYLAPLMEYICA